MHGCLVAGISMRVKYDRLPSFRIFLESCSEHVPALQQANEAVARPVFLLQHTYIFEAPGWDCRIVASSKVGRSHLQPLLMYLRPDECSLDRVSSAP